MAQLNPQEIKKRLSITQLLAYYKAHAANPNGLYYCISCKHPSPSLLATDANSRAKCEQVHCAIKNSDIFDLIAIIENCTFKTAKVRAYQIAEQLSSGSQTALFQPTDPSIVGEDYQNKNDTIPKLSALRKVHVNWFKDSLKVDPQWVESVFHVKGWYRHHFAIPIDINQESYAFIPLDPQKDQLFYRGKVRIAQIFPNNPTLQIQAKHIILCDGEAEVIRVAWELYRRGLWGEWTAITVTGNPLFLKKDYPLFANFDPKRVQSVMVAYSNDQRGWDFSAKLIPYARAYFTPETEIFSFMYSAAHPEILSFTDYLNHPTVERKAPFLPIPSEEYPALPTLPVKKNQHVYTRLAITSADIFMNEPTGQDIGFQHTVLCQVGMPRKKTDERVFERRNGNASILLEAGRLWTGTEWEEQELPYGPIPRLVMIYISSQAIVSQNPVIEIGDSLTEFMRRLNIEKSGGKKGRYSSFKKQLYALAACRMSLGMSFENTPITVDTKPIHKFFAWSDNEEQSQRLWSGYIELSNEFFNYLTDYAVPLDCRALVSLKHSALALDIYTWLANRLPRIQNPNGLILTWENLYEQFGQEYRHIKQFIDEFRGKMLEVKTIYQSARIEEVLDNRGYVRGYSFKNSPSPIPPNLLSKKRSIL